MLRTLITHIALICCSLALAGCGQKGPLYMPEENPAVEQPAASQQQAETD